MSDGDVPGLYAQPLPRVRRLRGARRIWQVASSVFCSAPGALLFGVIGPGLFLHRALDELRRDARVGFVVFFAVSMLFLALHVVVRPRSPRGAAVIGGALACSTAFAVLEGLTIAGLIVLTAAFALLIGHAGAVWTLLLGLAPLLGTAAYAFNAWSAWKLLGRRVTRWFALGVATPIGLAVLAQGGLNLAVSHCIERMLSDDRAAALAAADSCRRIPRSIVRWKPLARAWIDAKGGRWDNPETERSDRIADVFERLTGHDLRPYYDDSADF